MSFSEQYAKLIPVCEKINKSIIEIYQARDDLETKKDFNFNSKENELFLTLNTLLENLEEYEFSNSSYSLKQAHENLVLDLFKSIDIYNSINAQTNIKLYHSIFDRLQQTLSSLKLFKQYLEYELIKNP